MNNESDQNQPRITEPEIGELTGGKCTGEKGRITAGKRESYLVRGERGEALAEISGKMLFAASNPEDYPAVGDYVEFDYYDEYTRAIIHRLLPRRTMLRRKSPGRTIEHQILAANIDCAFIIQSLDRDFNPSRLERYLVMTGEGGIDSAFLLAKRDLVSADELEEKISRIRKIHPDLPVLAFSSRSGEGLPEIRDFMIRGMTYCFLGSSGVGKTTLLNILLGEERFATAPVRAADSRGRHTTVERRLIEIPGGALIIDTPGLRELGNFEIEEGLDATFPEIKKLAGGCRFDDCRHEQEPGCAVREALEDGTLDRDHFHNYLKLEREAGYYEMSKREKRERDKKFGKMVRNVMKGKRWEKGLDE